VATVTYAYTACAGHLGWVGAGLLGSFYRAIVLQAESARYFAHWPIKTSFSLLSKDVTSRRDPSVRGRGNVALNSSSRGRRRRGEEKKEGKTRSSMAQSRLRGSST
jgi:hypothetical protein